ncbi:unnamed protein product [Calypogeia fissa]
MTMKRRASCSSRGRAFGVLVLLMVSLSAPKAVQGAHSFCQALDPSPTLTPFKDPLPIMPTIDVSTGSQVTLGAYKITQKLHSEMEFPTTLYAYGTSQQTASFPGPSLVATRWKSSNVRFENHISDKSPFLQVDRTIHWANPPNGGVPIVTHLHGAEAKSDSDGNPDAWYTMFGDKGPKFVTQNYTYPNSQPATLLWYHDHSVGITRINDLAGLAGLYLIRSPKEEPEHLPSGIFEVPLVFRDVQLWANGSINFPDVGDSPQNHPNWCPEYFGDTILVNGMAWPYLNVYPAKYRFRMLNSANARFFNLSLSDPSLVFTQIGTDGGFLPCAQDLSSLLMPPAYRVDVIIDFSELAPGSSVYMNNSGAAPFPDGTSSFSPPQTNSVMEFRVVKKPSDLSIPKQEIPTSFGADSAMPPNFENDEGNKYRSLTLVEYDDEDGNPIRSILNNHTWTDPVTETPKVGSVEIWDIINFTPDAHPIHIHLIDFLTVYQQEFCQDCYDAGNCSLQVQYPDPDSCFTEYPQPPDASQVGWKDTVVVYPSAVTRFWTKWTPRLGGDFPFDPTAFPGYVWHCHILDHEDNDMMRPMRPKW